ncbi:MAG TPA: bifunctional oligoribonuclease/PAP phosphatase NrnA [Candidatus Manganitrophaceae bacterium]|nr:bifunctional oligoribonuclease/PAP phosphatase NrnA [Candidatus Manganitrophaceae bacterium]
MGLNEVISVLKKKETFLIAGHVNPEGDAVGSAVALALALRDLGKKAEVVNRDPLPRQLAFLCYDGIFSQRPAIIEPVDAMVVVDCGDLKRTGFFERGPLPIEVLVNIDHHVTNPKFGDVNWVVPEATATGEMIYDLLKEMAVPLTPAIATALYTALLSDTGAFRYANTNEKSLRIGAELIERGADPALIARGLFEIIRPEKLKLLGDVLTHMELSDDKKVAWVEVTQAQMERTNTIEADTEDFIDYPRLIRGVEAAVFFREVSPRQYKISLRSEGKVDVSALAKIWGGGGHRNAAGCTITGSREEIKKQVLGSLQEAVSASERLARLNGKEI